MDDTVARKKFGLMYDQHRRAILAYCMRRAGEQDALEAMNETFTIAWRRIERAPDPAEALPWLFSKARGVLSNQRRGRRRFARLISKTGSLAAIPDPGPEAQVVRRQELAEVAQALERLRPDDQEILRLQVWEELPHAAIGKVLGISENAVYQRVSRATKRLTAQVKQAPIPAPARRMTRKGGTA